MRECHQCHLPWKLCISGHKEVEYDLTLHHRWIDHRLSPDSNTRKMAVAGAIWTPKLTFTQGIVLRDPDDATQFWRGFLDGKVLYSERLTLRTECSQELEFFPFDTQTCYLKIGTYRFPIEEVQLRWESVPMNISPDVNMAQFHIADVAWYSETELRPTGNFSVLVVQLVLFRFPQHYIVTGLIPAVVMVAVSYLVFWMRTSDLVSRLLLCCSTMVVLSVSYMACNVPPTPYLKAFDIWFGVCAAFILVTMIESVAVESIARPTTKDIKLTNCRYEAIQRGEWLALWADRASRVLLPMSLLTFTAVYYGTYIA
ncbi:glycine receptor subunit beta-type 4-like isoform X2 [Periplaneta americana]|uniref:glycine receptor subunit beta-type 4-like isoform X2 n=1 Tax=Periplaneta americana TaxID=6978 RepID=UPI0037E85789